MRSLPTSEPFLMPPTVQDSSFAGNDIFAQLNRFMPDSTPNHPPLKLNLLADRKVLSADGQDISYISIRLLDEQNNVYKGFNESVDFYVSGNAQIAHIESSDIIIRKQNKSAHCLLRRGLGLLILQAGTTPEIVTLTAMGRGVNPDKIKIKISRGQKMITQTFVD